MDKIDKILELEIGENILIGIFSNGEIEEEAYISRTIGGFVQKTYIYDKVLENSRKFIALDTFHIPDILLHATKQINS